MKMIAVLLVNVMTVLGGIGETVVPCYNGTSVDEMATIFREETDVVIDKIETFAEENTLEIMDFDHDISMEKTGENTYKYHFEFSVKEGFDLNVRFVNIGEDKGELAEVEKALYIH